jgi:SAM-dependent methyltransferase
MKQEPISLPATSDPSAMRDYPDARNAERDALLDAVTLFPGMTTLDIQSAGGYLSDGIYRRLAGNVTCICIEPSAALRARLNPAFVAHGDPVEQFQSVEDACVDLVVGLAGLHHSQSHRATIEEAFRVLKPGGEIAICEVETGSPVARWLNEFVHEHSSAGHQGHFVGEGEMTKHFRRAGFQAVREYRQDVPWAFSSRSDIVSFFRGLFDLQCPAATIDAALDHYFNLFERQGRLWVDWSLLYCLGKKG